MANEMSQQTSDIMRDLQVFFPLLPPSSSQIGMSSVAHADWKHTDKGSEILTILFGSRQIDILENLQQKT